MSIDLDAVHVATRLLVATSCCIAAGATAYRRRFGYTLFYLLVAVETYAKLRYPASGAVRNLLLGRSPADATKYNFAKYDIQLVAMGSVALIGSATLIFILRNRRRSAAELTLLLGTFGVVGVLVVETISYHFIDLVIYRPIAGVMLSGWLYAVPALIAAVGALALRRQRLRGR